MSIATRIESIEEHIGNAYDELQGLGADLTNVNKNIENISSVLDDIYDSMPQVSGEGTSLTLDDTRVGKIKSTLKGNTSQTTYSGKNLCKIEAHTYQDLSRAPSEGQPLPLFNTNATIKLKVDLSAFDKSKTYTVSARNDITNLRCFYCDSNDLYISSESTGNPKTLSIPSNASILYIFIKIPNVTDLTTIPLENYKLQIEVGSSATSYEPYVGGTPSPNPSYPQPINVVSGDNEINVEGKNLLKYPYLNTTSTVSGVTFTDNGDGSITIDGTSTSSTYSLWFLYENAWNYNNLSLELMPGTYTFKALGTNKVSMAVNFYTSDNTNQYFAVYNSDVTKTITEKVRLNVRLLVNGGATVDNVTIYPQIEVGSSASTYEPYQGNTYNIDLPVENLWGGFSNSLSRTDSGVQFTANQDGTITASGTATNVATSIILSEATSNGIYKTLQKGTYTVSGGGAKYSVEVYDKNNVVKLGGIPVNGSSVSFTINSETQVVLRIQVANGITINETIKLQLEKGSSANSYTPYGTTPIELCKIGNYQDKFIRTSGKNLFNKNDTSCYVNGYSNAGVFNTTTFHHCFVIPCKPNTTYYISRLRNAWGNVFTSMEFPQNNTPTSPIVSLTLGTYDGVTKVTDTFTTGSNAKYLIISYIQDYIEPSTSVSRDKLLGSYMVSLENAEYEPYGVGKWYLHKEIGKVVLDGSERGWGRSGSSSSDVFVGALNLNQYGIGIYSKQSTASSWLVNKFSYGTLGALNKFNVYNPDATYGYNNIGFGISTDIVNDIDTFKTWVSSNNIVFHYLLATPTTTEITYQPLIDQLNLLEKAQSKENQTNISQVNNDLPFIISASALKEWSE